MNTNYYVIAVQGRYMVLRESQSRGLHDRPEQAVRAACFMASSEAVRIVVSASAIDS